MGNLSLFMDWFLSFAAPFRRTELGSYVQEAVALARAGSHTAISSNIRGANVIGASGSGSSSNSRGEYAPVGRQADTGDEDEGSGGGSGHNDATAAIEIGRRPASAVGKSPQRSASSAADHTAVEMAQSIM